MRTRCRLGSNRRLVATMEWLRLLPNAGPREQTWQTFGMAGEYRGGEAALAPTVRQCLHRRPRAVAACRGVEKIANSLCSATKRGSNWPSSAIKKPKRAPGPAGVGTFIRSGAAGVADARGRPGRADARGRQARPMLGGGRRGRLTARRAFAPSP